MLLDSAPGHRFIVDQLSGLETASGLRIRIGRIDGSIFGKSQLRNVTVADSSGVFLTSPNIKLDWTPGAWLDNKLYVDSLTAERVDPDPPAQAQAEHEERPDPSRLRHPRRRASGSTGSTSARRSAASRAAAASAARPTFAHGRALVELGAVVNNGGDRIAFHLDAEPDREQVRCLCAGDRAGRRVGSGDDRHEAIRSNWRSAARAAGRGGAVRQRFDLSDRPTARLALGVDSGRYRLQGQWAPAQFLTGKFERLTERVVTIRGDATLKDRLLDGELTAATPELRAVAKGTIDLANNRYRGMRLGIDLLKPAALFPNMTGKNVRMVWTLDGPFATADYSYRLTSDFVQFDNQRLHRPPCRGARAVHSVADARPDPPGGQGHHRHRRRCRSDARQSADRGLADGHAQTGAGAGPQAH